MSTSKAIENLDYARSAVRTIVLAAVLCGCAISTDSFRDKGSGDWVKEGPFTESDLDRDRTQCRADTYDVEHDRLQESHPHTTEPIYFPVMRSRQALDQCLRERGWRRQSEPPRKGRR